MSSCIQWVVTGNEQVTMYKIGRGQVLYAMILHLQDGQWCLRGLKLGPDLEKAQAAVTAIDRMTGWKRGD